MPSANRTLEDGQIVLVDGTYSLIHNIHGTVNDWPADSIEEARAAADERAKLAFYKRIEGEWTLDTEKTRELSIDSPIGDVTTPITVQMGRDGEFEISARGISVGNGMLQLAVDVSGRIDAKAIIHNDRLMYQAKITDVDASNGSLTLAGISLPGLEEVIEGFLNFFQRPQRIEVIRPDPDREEMHITADAGGDSEEMTQVLTRRKAWRKDILNRPVFVSQRSLHLCWAAALASILRTLKIANHGQSVTTPLPAGDPYPEFTIEGIIASVREMGRIKHKNWFHGDNFDPKRPPLKEPHGDHDRLLLEHDESDWSMICEWFHLPPIAVYSGTDPKNTPSGEVARVLTLADIKTQIDKDRYGLLAFSDKAWITPKEPKPTWHVVVVFGYDLDEGKVLVLDPNSMVFAAKQIDPAVKYFLTWKAAEVLDSATQKWVEVPGSRNKDF